MADVPRIDVGPLVSGDQGPPRLEVVGAIDRACREHGFFTVVNHGVDVALIERLEGLARGFFALDRAEKAQIAMAYGGRAWRGWFDVGDELTDGVADRKEGLYFGAELGPEDPRVRAGLALHGPNLFPDRPTGLRDAVLTYLDQCTALGRRLLAAIAVGLGNEPDWFDAGICVDPVVLFRIFHYPGPDIDQAAADDAWGVAEHTDYGLLTLLAQDETGGLEVRGPGGWVGVTPEPGALVCNLGDMLERISAGRYRSTPHRVHRPTAGGRIASPFFFDPSWDAEVPGIEGTYGNYLVTKVSRVFPALRDASLA